jgi:hypothetical protein
LTTWREPGGAPAVPVTERGDVMPAHCAGLTASSEARKRAKGLEPSTFSLGIAFRQLKTALLHSKRGMIVPIDPFVSPYFRTVPYTGRGECVGG